MNYRLKRTDFDKDTDKRWTAEYYDGEETTLVELLHVSDGIIAHLKNVDHVPRSAHVKKAVRGYVGQPEQIDNYLVGEAITAANELLDNYLNQND